MTTALGPDKAEWPLSQRGVERVRAARGALSSDMRTARETYRARIEEIRELCRPDDAPADVVLDLDREVFVLQEGAVDGSGEDEPPTESGPLLNGD